MKCSECGGERFMTCGTKIACINCKEICDVSELEGPLPDELKELIRLDEDPIEAPKKELTISGTGNENGLVLMVIFGQVLVLQPEFAKNLATSLMADAEKAEAFKLANEEKPVTPPEPDEPIAI